MASKVTFPETKKKITASKLKDSKSYRGEITKVTRKEGECTRSSGEQI